MIKKSNAMRTDIAYGPNLEPYNFFRAEQSIDDFKDPVKQPTIAVSVDMLETCIDVPEVVNLIFFQANLFLGQILGHDRPGHSIMTGAILSGQKQSSASSITGANSNALRSRNQKQIERHPNR